VTRRQHHAACEDLARKASRVLRRASLSRRETAGERLVDGRQGGLGASRVDAEDVVGGDAEDAGKLDDELSVERWREGTSTG
jgi:hypothetical protein